MSSEELAVSLRGVDKTFAIYERPHHRLLEALPGTGRRRWHRDFRALHNIDLDIHRGETVGVIGRNGSGKSTLLQVICGILTPTAGTREVSGRIAALLELGAGFNAEFSGRENVFLNGTVLGLTREQIQRRFDEIASFADIGDFMDQPVKTYSSGMYIRLAFAVAIHVEPDILVIDEALSVGDEAFQRKCFARIEKIRNSGATVLFVSHGSGTIIELCDRAVLIDAGELLAVGDPKSVISVYHKLLYAPPDAATGIRERIAREFADVRLGISRLHGSPDAQPAASPREEPDDYFDPSLVPATLDYAAQGAIIGDVRIENLDGRAVNVLRPGSRYVFRYAVCFDRLASLVRFGMMIRTVSGLEIAGCASVAYPGGIDVMDPGMRVEVTFSFSCLLSPGTYFFNAGVLGRLGAGEIFLGRRVDAAMFRVMPDPGRLATGIVDLNVEPALDMISRRTPAENAPTGSSAP